MNPDLQLLRQPSLQKLKELESVILGAPQFSLLSEGRLPRPEDVNEVLSELPPGGRKEQKYVFTINIDDTMIGCAEVIRGWPRIDIGFIGLLMLSEKYQGLGYGRLSFNELEKCISTWPEITRLRLAIVESNKPAFPFWRALGFNETGERIASTKFIADLVYFEKPISPSISL